MSAIDAYIETHKDRFLSELRDLLRIPSVSADPKYKADVAKCAEAVRGLPLRSEPLRAPSAGHPLVVAKP